MDEVDKKDDGNIIKENDIIKEQYVKKPGRITAGKKLAEFNRLKKLDMKKSENNYNYYYLGIPVAILILYFIMKTSDKKKYVAEPKVETKKSDHQIIIEI